MDPWRPVAPAEVLATASGEIGPEERASNRRKGLPSWADAEGLAGRMRHVRDIVGWMGVGRIVSAAVTVPLVALGAYFLLRTPSAPVETELDYATTLAPRSETTPFSASPSAQSITVHVAGHVHSPGVYVLGSGQRIVDALRAAGGAQPIADLNSINLALVIKDGEQIYVPAVGEVMLGAAVGRVGTKSSDSAATFPIDINSASASELDQLPGIGPSTAAAIVGHREEFGPFASPSGLLDVPGIGPSKLEAIENLVTT